MGNTTGVHTDKEVEHLTSQEREELRQKIIQLLRTSEDVRKIIASDKVLPKLMETFPNIREILKKEVQPTYEQYQKK